jgi:ABC-type transport system substrate-binding protein
MRALFSRLVVPSALALVMTACGEDQTPVASQPSPSPSATPTPVASPTPLPSPTPSPSGDVTTFAGIIDAIVSSNTVNVSDRIVEVDENTELLRQQTPITFADLRVGDDVAVQARARPDGTWLALQLKVRPQ